MLDDEVIREVITLDELFSIRTGGGAWVCPACGGVVLVHGYEASCGPCDRRGDVFAWYQWLYGGNISGALRVLTAWTRRRLGQKIAEGRPLGELAALSGLQ